MSSTSITSIMQSYGVTPVVNSGLTKNMRKRRNKKMKSAIQQGGVGGLRALMGSTEFNTYTDPARIKKVLHTAAVSSTCARLPGFDDSTTSHGGWGRLPNVSPIHYSEDDPRGWTYVGPHKRNRVCKIVDEEDDYLGPA